MRCLIVLLLAAAVAVTAVTTALVSFSPDDRDELVVVLDPGHGGSDTGAVNSALGLYESEINLKIALACRNRLKQYDGVKVYMTHTGVQSNVGKSSLSRRVSVAGEVGADIFISLHINSANNKTAAGAEVYVPITTHEARYNHDCTALAEKIIANFQALGLKSRGVKTRQSGGGRIYTFDDGTTETGDYYYVVGEPISRLGIPGILVEHAFIAGDSDFLDSDEDLIALGNADADAIAAHFGLTLKPEFVNVTSRPDDVSSNPVSSEVSSEPLPDTSSQAKVSSDEPFTSEDDEHSAVAQVETLIQALPDAPTQNDANQIKAARAAFNALSDSQQSQIAPELYQKLCDVITAYENLMHPVRIGVRQGSEVSVDRVNGRLLNVETASQNSGKITVFSLMLELELTIDPAAPEEYKQEDKLAYRIISPDGRQLGFDDELPNNSIISILSGDTVLDTLSVSIAE